MSEEVLPRIESIKIDPDGRYILLIEGLDAAEAARDLADAFRAWQDSDEKIIMVYGASGVEFHIEKVGEW